MEWQGERIILTKITILLSPRQRPSIAPWLAAAGLGHVGHDRLHKYYLEVSSIVTKSTPSIKRVDLINHHSQCTLIRLIQGQCKGWAGWSGALHPWRQSGQPWEVLAGA